MGIGNLASLIIPFTGQDLVLVDRFMKQNSADYQYLESDETQIELFTTGDPEQLSTLYDQIPLNWKSDAVLFAERVAAFADGKTMAELEQHLIDNPRHAALCVVMLMQVAGAFTRAETIPSS